MPTYVAVADVQVGEFQNVQELASIWGDLRTDLEERDVLMKDAYVLLGDKDVLMILEAPSRNAALEASIAAQHYGISLQTMEAMNVDRLGELVNDT